ncbi:type IV secretory system conjugative DNA transfer family protein [Paeniglutamicibacter cryotolerans]|uniref:Type IV secretory pathway TraG/TraD family ATPase VirD4 n=1 Tax=Paeniglutamicibacter cryotolerans TaxID=670079 RepID=A0A839QMA3_9MICC|nr:TraM recognition domain-containing protein [Paeniglutamicibacter cryotolerans]MBB2997558.1 type IV secretory pathway TraG/TraD family ATPase VirD4 [Paeniglutamicibacter cryotolerans]
MSAPNRKGTSGTSGQALLPFILVSLVLLILGGGWVSFQLGARLAGDPEPPTSFPAVLRGLVDGSLLWPVQGTVIAITLAIMLALLAASIGVLRTRSGRSRSTPRVDKAARYLGRGQDIAAYTPKGATKTAKRLGVTGTPGLFVGTVVSTNQPFYQGWEDLSLDIWGPRVGKSASRVIPAILDAPGCVLSTSNKRDVLDATRGTRVATAPVWVFDPQQIAHEEPSWWWDPLSYVTDEDKAAKLTHHFAVASRITGARTDAYFDPKAEDLISSLFLAATLGNLSIIEAYVWIASQECDHAIDLLTENNYPLQATGLQSIMRLTEKQKDGIFGTAEKILQCLKNRQTLSWVTPQPGTTLATDPRPRFEPAHFATSTQTLYVLSREGVGSAAPLTTALTAAVAEALEEHATRTGGRLRVPAVFALDELANVVRWAGLPELFSHYGSRGIIVMAILQSWSQGVELWGESGMRKIWSAANVVVYGGGVKEDAFLRTVSDLIGDYSYTSVSRSAGRAGPGSSQQEGRERILDVSDLAEMERGRAVVFASGARATLIKTLPWWKSSHQDAVNRSLARYAPNSPPKAQGPVMSGESSPGAPTVPGTRVGNRWRRAVKESDHG